MRHCLHRRSKHLVGVEFVAYDEVVSGGIVKSISTVIRQEPVGVAVVASDVVI